MMMAMFGHLKSQQAQIEDQQATLASKGDAVGAVQKLEARVARLEAEALQLPKCVRYGCGARRCTSTRAVCGSAR
jgi:hypothetical protein